MDQELFFKASILEKQSQELQENLILIERQVSELEQFNESLKDFSSSKEKTMLSPLGRSVFVSTEIKDKNLFVDVGSGVVVRKTPEETMKVIKSQIGKFKDAEASIKAQIELHNKELQSILQEFEKSKEPKD